MKKLLLTPLIVVAMATPAYIVSQHPKVLVKEVPVTVTKTVTQTIPAVIPSYHIGDTQTGGGITATLSAVYIPATPLLDKFSPGPSSTLFTAQVKNSGSYTDLLKQSVIYTPEGYITPVGIGVKECPEPSTAQCVTFIVPNSVKVDSFIYKDFKWYL